MGKKSTHGNISRIHLLFVVFFLIAAAIVSRLFFIQVLKGDYWAALSQGQSRIHEEVEPTRGTIFLVGRSRDSRDLEFFPTAINKQWPFLYAVPQEIENAEDIARILSPVFQIPVSDLVAKLGKKGDPHEILKRKLSDEEVLGAKELNIPGILIGYEEGRFYPSENLASHIVGFLGFKGDSRVGQYGIEEAYEKELRGEIGTFEGEVDARGHILSLVKRIIAPSKDGHDVVLTIDANIQFAIEKYLREVMEKLDAEGGSIAVMDPHTGRILAMANYPDFNPNDYAKVEDVTTFLNPVIHTTYEPGSVFKLITMAAALDENVITPQTTYSDTGEEKIGGYTIRNFDGKNHGVQTMTAVLEQSLNTGAIFAEREVGHEKFYEYVRKFGFSERTGIDVHGEANGNISNLSSGRDINFATASFGQGISVTPIQLLRAVSAIANGGKLVHPYVVEEIISPDGKHETQEPQIGPEVIRPETASRLTAMMVSTVKKGYDRKAEVPGYFVAGKTGTAQVPHADRPGYSDKVIHSFVGFAPAFHPKFVALIKIDNPKGIRFAADSLSPVFRKIGEYILNYYQVPPDEEPVP